MSVWMALVGGIVLGWLIEWVVDWVFWRRGAEAFFTVEQELRQELQTTRKELDAANARIEELTAQLARHPVATPTGNGR